MNSLHNRPPLVRCHSGANPEAGFMILEVLLAVLIFSLGVLGIIGLQANAVKQSGQSQYRADATLLANELIGNMWVGNRTPTALQADYGTTPNATYTAWQAKVQSTLPGAVANPPTVTLLPVLPLTPVVPAGSVAPPTPSPSTQVTIRINWKLPSDPASDPAHNIVVVTQIK